MRLSASEKQEIIHLVDNSDLGVNRTLRELGIHKRTFYNWYKAYADKGIDGLQPSVKRNRQHGIPSHRNRKTW
jgi:putative transposase